MLKTFLNIFNHTQAGRLLVAHTMYLYNIHTDRSCF